MPTRTLVDLEAEENSLRIGFTEIVNENVLLNIQIQKLIF